MKLKVIVTAPSPSAIAMSKAMVAPTIVQIIKPNKGTLTNCGILFFWRLGLPITNASAAIKKRNVILNSNLTGLSQSPPCQGAEINDADKRICSGFFNLNKITGLANANAIVARKFGDIAVEVAGFAANKMIVSIK